MDESLSSLGGSKPDVGPSSVKDDKPKILFMGDRGAGKSSIREVVFHKLDPEQTLLLERTRRPTQDAVNSYVELEIWDLPGSLEADDFSMPLTSVGAVIFVVDAQSRYADSFPRLAHAIVKAHQLNPGLCFEVFLHKIDSYAPDYRQELMNEVKDGLTEELAEHELAVYEEDTERQPVDLASRVQYRLTSVYDYSIHEALSRVIMKVIPQQAALENLMNLLAQQSGIQKCFLFDVWTKLYIATDSSPVDPLTLSLCSELMDLFADFSELYGVPCLTSPVTRPPPLSIPPGLLSSVGGGPRDAFRSQSRSESQPSRDASPAKVGGADLKGKAKKVAGKMATSQVRLEAERGVAKVVSCYEINDHLSLVCVIHEDTARQQSGLIEYNVAHLRQSVNKILELNSRRRRGASMISP